MKILRINPQDALKIRKENLPSECLAGHSIFDFDDEEQSFHLGAFEDNKLVSVASFYFENNPAIEGENHYRLRGLATDQSFRNKGIATNILNSALPLIKSNMCSTIWCNAQKESLPFYLKNGFNTKQDSEQENCILVYKKL